MKKLNVGGQALIEGLLMLSPTHASVAVRKPDGIIDVKRRALAKKGFFSRLPIVRGAILLIRQMFLGIKALMYSAEFVEIDEPQAEGVEPSKFDKFLTDLLGNKIKDAVIYFSVLVSLVFSVGVFILLPNLLAGIMHFDKNTPSGLISYNLVEGIVRVTFFVVYIVLVSKLKDIKRVWEYHGAEHKTINCYENDEELTIENVRKYSRIHPRCGTSFLFTVMIISILVFSFTGWHSVILNVVIRLSLVPLVAGISYEILKLAGKCKNKFVKLINEPGMFFQKFTTSEPDDSQIEVAIVALKSALSEEEGIDEW